MIKNVARLSILAIVLAVFSFLGNTHVDAQTNPRITSPANNGNVCQNFTVTWSTHGLKSVRVTAGTTANETQFANSYWAQNATQQSVSGVAANTNVRIRLYGLVNGVYNLMETVDVRTTSCTGGTTPSTGSGVTPSNTSKQNPQCSQGDWVAPHYEDCFTLVERTREQLVCKRTSAGYNAAPYDLMDSPHEPANKTNKTKGCFYLQSNPAACPLTGDRPVRKGTSEYWCEYKEPKLTTCPSGTVPHTGISLKQVVEGSVTHPESAQKYCRRPVVTTGVAPTPAPGTSVEWKCPASSGVINHDGLCYSVSTRPKANTVCNESSSGYNVAPYKIQDGVCKYVMPGAGTASADNYDCPLDGKRVHKFDANGRWVAQYCTSPNKYHQPCPVGSISRPGSQSCFSPVPRERVVYSAPTPTPTPTPTPIPTSTPVVQPTAIPASTGSITSSAPYCAGGTITWNGGTGNGHWWVTAGTARNPTAYMNKYVGWNATSTELGYDIPAKGSYNFKIFFQPESGGRYVRVQDVAIQCAGIPPTPTPTPTPTSTPVVQPTAVAPGFGKFSGPNQVCNNDPLTWDSGPGHWWVTVGTADNPRAYMNEYAGGAAANKITLTGVPSTGSYTAYLWHQPQSGGAYKLSDSRVGSCAPDPSATTPPGVTQVGKITGPSDGKLCANERVRWNTGNGYWWVTIGTSSDPRAYANIYGGGSSSDSVLAGSSIPADGSPVLITLWHQRPGNSAYVVSDTKTVSCGGGGGTQTPGTPISPVQGQRLCAGGTLSWQPGSGYWWVTLGNAYNMRAYADDYAGGPGTGSITVRNIHPGMSYTAYIWNQAASGQPYKVIGQANYTCYN